MVKLPGLFQGSTRGYEIALVVLAIVPIGYLVTYNPGRALEPVLVALLAGEVIVTVIEIERQVATHDVYTGKIGLLTAGVWVGVAVACLAAASSSANVRIGRTVLLLVPAVYVISNVVLQIAGMSSGGGLPDQNELLGLIGIHTVRVGFPLSPGTNYNVFGTVCGAAVAIAAFRVGGRSREAWLFRVTLALALYGIVRADSRGALASAVAAIALTALQRRSSLRFAWAASLVIPVSAVLALAVAQFLGTHGIVASSGSGRADVATLSSRDQIWRPAIAFLESPQDNVLFGYGTYGQTESGVSDSYALLLRNTAAASAQPRLATVHNLGLQTALDGGAIALLVIMGLYARAIWNVSAAARADPLAASALAGLLFWIVAGITEATPSLYFPEALASFVALVVCASTFNHRVPLRRFGPAVGDRLPATKVVRTVGKA